MWCAVWGLVNAAFSAAHFALYAAHGEWYSLGAGVFCAFCCLFMFVAYFRESS